MRIIPAIDIIDGKCVRLSKGDYSTKKLYNENPLEVAKQFENQGVKHLHLVDLDGARSQHIINHRVLEMISSKTNLKVDFGGGIKSHEDIKIAFLSGAYQITGGSIALDNRPLFEGWIQEYGSEKIILGADARNGKIATQGWIKTSNQTLTPFIKAYHEKGIKYVVCTDISKDGMLEGVAENLYKNLLFEVPHISLIASGGVASIDDVQKLSDIGCEAVIIGKALYENRISLKDLELFL